MASFTVFPVTPSPLCSSKNGMNSPSQAALVKFVRSNHGAQKENRMSVSCMASIPADDRVPDMGKRELMNLLLLGALSLPSAGMLLPYASFFVPPGSGGSGGGTIAKDALGNDVVADVWLKNHGPGDRTLTQGLKGDPTYLVVENDRTLGNIWHQCRSALTSVVWCHGILLRGSSSAPATDHNTTIKERLLEDRLHCRWLWFMLMLTMGRYYLFHGLKQISGLVKLHGGRNYIENFHLFVYLMVV
ncbi:Cytochrome b6-f complex iron-sulfur subunit [Abeliophyllum distichum]|uniref:Cytochrome b6-f complex iron-sulfur subunit n=1 Tax=Abeliophyllum distichum TaxID=126358 RepID=A0ABD1PR79_9LAMI